MPELWISWQKSVWLEKVLFSHYLWRGKQSLHSLREVNKKFSNSYHAQNTIIRIEETFVSWKVGMGYLCNPCIMWFMCIITLCVSWRTIMLVPSETRKTIFQVLGNSVMVNLQSVFITWLWFYLGKRIELLLVKRCLREILKF